VIAPSSFYHTDVSEATLTAVTNNPDGTATLALDTPLAFTHLGEVVTVPGDDRGHVLDMRAEVAVLSRSVVLQGDEGSAATMYGAHVLLSTPKQKKVRGAVVLEDVELRRMGQAFRMGR
jgi:hypothetical protein